MKTNGDNLNSAPDLAAMDMSPEAKAARLARFVGPALHEDEDQARAWQERSDAEHARVGADLSDLAAQMVVQTGIGKDPTEMFPGLSSFARTRRGDT